MMLSILAGALEAAELTDQFTDRELITEDSGQIDSSNVGASVEIDEPRHGGKPGGRSVWVSWMAPGDGVATFWTDGSDFDTLLSAYYFQQPAETTLDKLKEADRNDDDPTRVPSQTSLIQFGARAGTRYEIAIDGYRGAEGEIRLRWDFLSATSPPPVVVSIPDDRAARQGDTVTLMVDLQASPNLRLQWRLNGNSFGAQGATLVIPDLQPANLGRYTLRIDLGDVRFETRPIELQINSDGQTNALARDKVFDALNSPLLPSDGDGGGGGSGAGFAPSGGEVGLSRGYNGTQIFNTSFATPDPNEPQACGLSGGASYWYAYRPPADGTLTLDTIGSDFDTFLAVYTFDEPFTSYDDLIPIACDNDSASTNGAALLEFAAPKARQFLVVVDGIAGARGVVHLNYVLDTNRPPVAPRLMEPVQEKVVATGASVTLAPAVTGSSPLHFIWSKGADLLPGATNSVLTMLGVGRQDSGDYVLTVSSHVGLPLNVAVPLRVVDAPRLQLFPNPDHPFAFEFFGVQGQRYVLEQTEALGQPWHPLGQSFLGDGSFITVTNDLQTGSVFYRLRVE